MPAGLLGRLEHCSGVWCYSKDRWPSVVLEGLGRSARHPIAPTLLDDLLDRKTDRGHLGPVRLGFGLREV